MIEVVGTIAAKGGFLAISSVFRALTTAAVKKYQDRKLLQIPSIYDLHPISSWYEEQLTLSHLTNDEEIDENLSSYLNSREFTCFIQFVFSYIFTGRSISQSPELQLELHRGLATYGYENSEDEESLYRILTTVSTEIYKLSRADELELPSTASVEAHAIISTATLGSIDDQLRKLLNKSITPAHEIKKLVDRYKQALLSKHGKIQPQSFDGAPKFDINELYVVPSLTIRTGEKDAERVPYSTMISNFRRIVVVGDPGGGKTTLSSKVACDLTNGSLEVNGIKGQIIPFIIVLRDFGTFLKGRSGSIIDYISETSATVYQVPLSTETVETLLQTGHLYVIFDGLDELLDTSYRKEIAEKIDIFSILYPAAQMLVTSRVVGYAHNSLNDDIFTKFTLGEFDPSQVSEYVNNWFRLMPANQETPEEAKAQANRFIVESDHANDIRSNPLMLGLMCTIYKTESYIPRNRPDVYEKCSRMLFKNWDKSRGIGDPVKFEFHIDGAVAHLAEKIYASSEMQSGVAERALVELSTEYFLEWAYANQNEAHSVSQDFVDLCKGRAWILAEAGLSPDGETLFRFTHRTFLEHYTATHIWLTCETINDLCQKLIPRIIIGELDVVAELAFQMAAKSKQGGGDIIVNHLTEAYEETKERSQRQIISSFIARSLSFLVLSPKAIKLNIPKLVTGSVIDCLPSSEAGEVTPQFDNSLFPILSKSVRESRDQIRESISETLINLSKEDWEIDEQLLPSISWDFPSEFSFNATKLTETGADGFPKDVQELREVYRSVLLDNYHEWPWACIALFYDGVIDATQALEFYPQNFLMLPAGIPNIVKRYTPPLLFIASELIAFLSRPTHSIETHRFDVRESARIIAQYIRSNYPLQTADDIYELSTWSMLHSTLKVEKNSDFKRDFTRDEINDLALIIATTYRGTRKGEIEEIDINEILDLPTNVQAIWSIISKRDGFLDLDQDEIDDPLVLAWSKSEVNLTTLPEELAESDGSDLETGLIQIAE